MLQAIRSTFVALIAVLFVAHAATAVAAPCVLVTPDRCPLGAEQALGEVGGDTNDLATAPVDHTLPCQDHCKAPFLAFAPALVAQVGVEHEVRPVVLISQTSAILVPPPR